MPFRLFDAPQREASQFVGFAGNTVDRQSEKRSDDAAARALEDPAARLLLIGGGRLLAKPDGERIAPWFSRAEAGLLGVDEAGAVLLGTMDGRPVLACDLAFDAEQPPRGLAAPDLRALLNQGLADEATVGAVAQAAALLAWHAGHRFCGRCGSPTESRIGGYKRVCGDCGAELFPRTDPVAIMLTVRGDACLLGRGRHFAAGMYSALAGFIEPGETIEAAVRRETFEESGIRLGRVVYHASQPWPFPYSLMIGCYGEALNGDIVPDTAELEACRWFPRDEVLAMIEGTHPDGLRLPPPGAIAFNLIRDWAEDAG